MPNLIVFDDLTLGSTFLFGKHQVGSETPWDIEWEIVHQEDNYQIAQTVQVIDVGAFDAKEVFNNNFDRASSGNNNWKLSNIRQWLNSDASAGNWYSAQHSADAPPRGTDILIAHPVGYDTRSGFLYHFTDIQKEVLLNFDLTLALPPADGGGSHIVSQKVFLPTMTQVGFGNNEDVGEGTVFDKYNGVDDDVRVKTIHPNVVVNAGYSRLITNRTKWYWLSSVYTDSPYACNTSIDGSLGCCYPYYGYGGCAPCICLPRKGEV